MAFHNYEVEEDVNFTNDSDPVLKKLEKKAGAAVIQDITMGTYWANTVGRTKYPGVYTKYKEELMFQLGQLLGSDMTYRQIEEFLNIVGYDSNDIRCAFKKMTGIDPVKLEFMRLEDLKKTPGNIPGFNLGWGFSKKKAAESYFIMPNHRGWYSIFEQKNDMERSEVKSFLNRDEAYEHLASLVKEVHRYDKPVIEAIEEEPELDPEEPTSKFYTAIANRFYDLEKKGALTEEYVQRMVVDTVTSGNITEAEGQYLLKKYAAPEPLPPSPMHTEEVAPATDDSSETIKEVQDDTSVTKELKKRTPQDFFQATLPNRIEEIATEHIDDVLSYVANRESDIQGYGIKLHSLQYQKHEPAKGIGQINPQTGEPAGPPEATISTILEVENKTMPSEKNVKFVLAVFFVNANGQISTSDSVKGEDDIIYGFTQEGLDQYFSKSMKEAL